MSDAQRIQGVVKWAGIPVPFLACQFPAISTPKTRPWADPLEGEIKPLKI
jgi:hypothetical protein